MTKGKKDRLGSPQGGKLRRKAEQRLHKEAADATGPVAETDVCGVYCTSCRCIRLNWRCNKRSSSAQATAQEFAEQVSRSL